MRDQATEELWSAIAPHLPTRQPSPKGGRPPVDDRRALEGILYVLREGIRWQSLPLEMGCGSGSTCWRRFAAWTKAGVWDKAHDHLIAALGEAGLLNLERALIDSASSRAQKGGGHTGPNPVDRGKRGLKRHVVTDANGLPLVVVVGPANRRDEQRVPGLLWLLWGTLSRCGLPLPWALQGDRGYGFAATIALVLAWGLRSLLARRGSDHGSGLGRRRWPVERTHSWLSRFRRLAQCYERYGAHAQGFHVLAACVICARRLRQGRPPRKEAARQAA